MGGCEGVCCRDISMATICQCHKTTNFEPRRCRVESRYVIYNRYGNHIKMYVLLFSSSFTAVRPQQNRFMVFKDDMKLPDDTRSLMSRMKIE